MQYREHKGCHTATGTHMPHDTVLPATRQRLHCYNCKCCIVLVSIAGSHNHSISENDSFHILPAIHMIRETNGTL